MKWAYYKRIFIPTTEGTKIHYAPTTALEYVQGTITEPRKMYGTPPTTELYQRTEMLKKTNKEMERLMEECEMSCDKKEIDLSTVKAGDVVKFRCGGNAAVKEIKMETVPVQYFKTLFEGESSYVSWYWQNGRFDDETETPFDIVAIEPKAFDWADVKPGMAFFYQGILIYFVGKDPLNTAAHVFTENDIRSFKSASYQYESFTKFLEDMIRAPEHDIKL